MQQIPYNGYTLLSFQLDVAIRSGFFSLPTLYEYIDIFTSTTEEDERVSLKLDTTNHYQHYLEATATFPEVTDCDRLFLAFQSLKKQSIIGVPWCDNAPTAACDMAVDIAAEEGYDGCCYFHEQDLTDCLEQGELYISFTGLEETEEDTLKVGDAVFAALAEAGLSPQWQRSPYERIVVPEFTWQNRYDAEREERARFTALGMP